MRWTRKSAVLHRTTAVSDRTALSHMPMCAGSSGTTSMWPMHTTRTRVHRMCMPAPNGFRTKIYAASDAKQITSKTMAMAASWFSHWIPTITHRIAMRMTPVHRTHISLSSGRSIRFCLARSRQLWFECIVFLPISVRLEKHLILNLR